MEAKTTIEANAIKEVVERCSVIIAAIVEIVWHARQQDFFNGSVRTSVNCLESKSRHTKTTSRKLFVFSRPMNPIS